MGVEVEHTRERVLPVEGTGSRKMSGARFALLRIGLAGSCCDKLSQKYTPLFNGMQAYWIKISFAIDMEYSSSTYTLIPTSVP